MKNPHEVPMAWKLGFVVTVLMLILVVLGTLSYLAFNAVGTCTSEAHLSDFCDPYHPNIPGKEGR